MVIILPHFITSPFLLFPHPLLTHCLSGTNPRLWDFLSDILHRPISMHGQFCLGPLLWKRRQQLSRRAVLVCMETQSLSLHYFHPALQCFVCSSERSSTTLSLYPAVFTVPVMIGRYLTWCSYSEQKPGSIYAV